MSWARERFPRNGDDDVALVAIFRIDDYGYPRFTNSGFMERAEAEAIRQEFYPDCVLLTYGEYKRDMDPDSMSQKEHARHFGGKVAPKKVIAITGTIPGLSREQAVAKAKALGFTVTETVKIGLAFVWAGAKAGSKARVAAALGIPVVSELPASI